MAELFNYNYKETVELFKDIKFFKKLLQYIKFYSGTLPIETVTANYTAQSVDYTVLVDTTAGNITLTLPVASQGKIYNIKKISSDVNTVTVVPTSGLIDGSANSVISILNTSKQYQFDGTNYFII
jgi:hypothetical protein